MGQNTEWSLILPSRERLSLLTGLLQSLDRTTEYKDRLEVLIAIDDDDSPTCAIAPTLAQLYPFARFICCKRASNMSVEYFNRLALEESKGRNIMGLNDDVEFTDMAWDVIGSRALDGARKQWKDGVALGKCNDGLGTDYPCFPVLTLEALTALGFFFHCETTFWGADIVLYNIFADSRVNRVVDLGFSVRHLSHHTGLRQRDDLNHRMYNVSKYNYACAPGEANRLKDILASLAERNQ